MTKYAKKKTCSPTTACIVTARQSTSISVCSNGTFRCFPPTSPRSARSLLLFTDVERWCQQNHKCVPPPTFPKAWTWTSMTNRCPVQAFSLTGETKFSVNHEPQVSKVNGAATASVRPCRQTFAKQFLCKMFIPWVDSMDNASLRESFPKAMTF
jgi:hypothetical protein